MKNPELGEKQKKYYLRQMCSSNNSFWKVHAYSPVSKISIVGGEAPGNPKTDFAYIMYSTTTFNLSY